jgi:hypothetical protein
VAQHVSTEAATPVLLNNFKFIILVTSRLTEILNAIHKLRKKNQESFNLTLKYAQFTEIRNIFMLRAFRTALSK